MFWQSRANTFVNAIEMSVTTYTRDGRCMLSSTTKKASARRIRPRPNRGRVAALRQAESGRVTTLGYNWQVAEKCLKTFTPRTCSYSIVPLPAGVTRVVLGAKTKNGLSTEPFAPPSELVRLERISATHGKPSPRLLWRPTRSNQPPARHIKTKKIESTIYRCGYRSACPRNEIFILFSRIPWYIFSFWGHHGIPYLRSATATDRKEEVIP